MLTKDLIRVRVSGGSLKPQFVDVTDTKLLGLAEQLLSLYVVEEHPSRADIEEATGPLVNGFWDVKLAKGLHKLLQDRSEFSQGLELDYVAMRMELFAASARLLKRPGELKVADFRDRTIEDAGVSEAFVEGGIYADLPEFEELIGFKAVSPRQLLERYNVSLVQSLLLRASELEVVVASKEAAKLRRLFKYLRFFRLLGRLYRVPKKRGAVRMVIDGPASLLDQSKRYGLQLASFFPAVCALDRWAINTQVEWKGQVRPLKLNQRSALVCPYTNFGAYVPEEIKLFHKQFQASVEGWSIVGHTPFLEADGQEVVFPDLSFEHDGGQVIHLELFHRWHATQLSDRLRHLRERPELPLIFGVDRHLYGKPEIREALDASEAFAVQGFLFRDYPPVARVKTCLKRVLDKGTPELGL